MLFNDIVLSGEVAEEFDFDRALQTYFRNDQIRNLIIGRALQTVAESVFLRGLSLEKNPANRELDL